MASPKTLAEKAKREALEEFRKDHPKYIRKMPPSSRNARRTAHKEK